MAYSSVQTWGRLADWFVENRRSGQADNDLIQTPAVLDVVGDVSGLSVLDIGCGYGGLAIELARRGAHVTALDPAPRMVKLTRQAAIASGVDLDVIQASVGEARDLHLVSQDVVLVVTLLRYLDDPGSLMALVSHALAPSGRLVLSDVHPLMTAGGKPGELQARTVSRYFDTSVRTHSFTVAGESVELRAHHRTLQDIFGLLHDVGLVVTRFLEPRPHPEETGKHAQRYVEAGNRFPTYYVLEAIRGQ